MGIISIICLVGVVLAVAGSGASEWLWIGKESVKGAKNKRKKDEMVQAVYDVLDEMEEELTTTPKAQLPNIAVVDEKTGEVCVGDVSYRNACLKNRLLGINGCLWTGFYFGFLVTYWFKKNLNDVLPPFDREMDRACKELRSDSEDGNPTFLSWSTLKKCAKFTLFEHEKRDVELYWEIVTIISKLLNSYILFGNVNKSKLSDLEKKYKKNYLQLIERWNLYNESNTKLG